MLLTTASASPVSLGISLLPGVSSASVHVELWGVDDTSRPTIASVLIRAMQTLVGVDATSTTTSLLADNFDFLPHDVFSAGAAGTDFIRNELLAGALSLSRKGSVGAGKAPKAAAAATASASAIFVVPGLWAVGCGL